MTEKKGEGRISLAAIQTNTGPLHVYGVVDLAGPQEHVVVHPGGDLRTHGYAIRRLDLEEGGRVS